MAKSAYMTKKQARAIYNQVKRDLTGKTIQVWGKTGTVQKVYEHYTDGATALVKFQDGSEAIIHPTRDHIEIVTPAELPADYRECEYCHQGGDNQTGIAHSITCPNWQNPNRNKEVPNY